MSILKDSLTLAAANLIMWSAFASGHAWHNSFFFFSKKSVFWCFNTNASHLLRRKMASSGLWLYMLFIDSLICLKMTGSLNNIVSINIFLHKVNWCKGDKPKTLPSGKEWSRSVGLRLFLHLTELREWGLFMSLSFFVPTIDKQYHLILYIILMNIKFYLTLPFKTFLFTFGADIGLI